jgi:hypothetical protein
MAEHVERPMRLAGGKTYCACGRPWPCLLEGHAQEDAMDAESETLAAAAVMEILGVFDADLRMTEEIYAVPADDRTAESDALVKIREIGRRWLEGRQVPAVPVTMGHFDAIEGALAGAAGALERGARTREWDSLQAAMGEAWADIQRAIGYAQTLKGRVPDGPGFETR